MIFREETIALASIDHRDVTFRITTQCRTDDLQRSIPVLGLLSPPLVISKTRNYAIVSGFRRIAACREIGRSRIRVRILPDTTDPLLRVQLAIAENTLQRPLNLIEQSRALNLLAAKIADPVRLNQTASWLGLPSHSELVKKILPLCRLPAAIQEGVLSGRVSLAMADALQRHEPETAVEVVRVFEMLKLGLNRQREVLNLLEEIAAREDCTPSDVLNSTRFRDLISDPNPDGAQKSRRLIELLNRRRYPHITQKTETFQRRVARLDLKGDIRLKPPKHFETGLYTLAFTFATADEFSERIEQLGKLSEDPTFKKLLD